jgi:hypothetical protein
LSRLDRRAVWLWAARFGLGLLLLALPWPGFNDRFVAGYSALVNHLVLAHVTFGQGGHAQLRSADAIARRADQNVVPDAVIGLRVDGYGGELPIAMSLRRDAWLPICVLLAVILAAPLPGRRRGRALCVGIPTIVALTIACQCFGILWLFSQQLATVMTLGPRAKSLIDGLYQTLLLPPANRFVVPLLLGIALIGWQLGSSTPAPAVGATVTASPA